MGEGASPSRSSSSRTPASESTSPIPEHERGRSIPQALDGSAVDDAWDRDVSMSRELSVASAEKDGLDLPRRRRGWRTGGERGVPSWLEGG